MKAINGIILTAVKDENTNMESFVPFFPIVRREDIIITNLDIDKLLTEVSDKWIKESAIDYVGFSEYVFTRKFVSPVKITDGEQVGSTYLDARVHYKLYEDGRMDVFGRLRMNGTIDTREERFRIIEKSVYLPYAIPKKNLIEVRSSLGENGYVHLFGRLQDVQVTNTTLNPGLGDDNLYASKLVITEMFPIENLDGVDFIEQMRKVADPEYNSYLYESYINDIYPVNFEIKDARWK